MAVKAVGKGVGLSVKRVRPVLDELRGKNVQSSLDSLRFMPGVTAASIAKVLKSAAANAENNMMLNVSRLKVVQAFADPGPVLKRMRAKARGRAGKVIRRSSHITIVVDEEA